MADISTPIITRMSCNKNKPGIKVISTNNCSVARYTSEVKNLIRRVQRVVCRWYLGTFIGGPEPNKLERWCVRKQQKVTIEIFEMPVTFFLAGARTSPQEMPRGPAGYNTFASQKPSVWFRLWLYQKCQNVPYYVTHGH